VKSCKGEAAGAVSKLREKRFLVVAAISGSCGPWETGAHTAEAEAARELFERYRTPIYRFCLSQLRSREDAEDALQNTFMRAFTALQKGVEPKFASAWLFKIARNVCLSRRLSASRRARVETPRDLSAVPEEVLAGPQVDHDTLFGLDEALAELPPNLRQALLLREWQGLSYREIADELGVSQAAVETLIFRARRELARRLEQPWRRVREALLGPWAAIKSLFAPASAPTLTTAAATDARAGGRAPAGRGR
jgi:RNA polymerase sigma factor (sigma-70 family)